MSFGIISLIKTTPKKMHLKQWSKDSSSFVMPLIWHHALDVGALYLEFFSKIMWFACFQTVEQKLARIASFFQYSYTYFLSGVYVSVCF